jgi:hypothetical protein
MSYSPNGWDTLICWKCHHCGFAVAGLVKSPQEKNALWNDTQAARQSAPPQIPAPQGEDGPEQCQSCGQEVAVNCRSDMCPHRWRFDTGAQQATVTSMQHEYVGGRTYSTISPGLPVGTVLVAAPQGEMPELEKAVDKLIQQAWMLGDACCADQLDFADVFTHARGDSHISWLRDQVSEYKRAVMSAATPQGVRHEGGEGEQ